MRSICVFCGSSPGARPAYVESARLLGRMLADREIGLVYGGASVGLMRAVADAALGAGGSVFGVIPRHLVDREIAHPGLSELYVVSSMHERKAKMADLSDGFVALPGGFGTLDELMEALTWSQLGLQSKPCGVLDVDGFFGRLIDFVDHAVAEGFIPGSNRDLLLVEDDAGRLLDSMEAWVRPLPSRP